MVVVVLARRLWEAGLLFFFGKSLQVVGHSHEELGFLPLLAADNLRDGAEVILTILHRVLNGPILRMQRAKVLEGVTALRLLPLGAAAVWNHIHTAVAQNPHDLVSVEVLQRIEVDGLEQVQLIICQVFQFHVVRELLEQDEVLSGQGDRFTRLLVQNVMSLPQLIECSLNRTGSGFN